MKNQRSDRMVIDKSLEPYQWFTIATLVVIWMACGTAFIFRNGNNKYTWLIGSLLAIYIMVMKGSSFFKNEALRMGISSFLTVGIMWSLYSILGTLTFEIMPYTADSWLAQIDRVIGFGHDPVVLAASFLNRSNASFFSFVYAIFVPYLYVSILMSLIGRPHLERKVFITAFSITYAISFLGYLFLPARGPIVFLVDKFYAPIPENYFYNIIMETLEKCGGPHGAFPSLHVGAAWFACFFDLKYNRLRGLLYFPLVIMIVLATVLLRFHYVIDLLAGGIIGSFAVLIAAKLILGANRT